MGRIEHTMPDLRLQRTREAYDDAPPWRRPSDNAAEVLLTTCGCLPLPPGCPTCRTFAECAPYGTHCRALDGVTANVIDGDPD
jgi:hypothetical protein